MALAYVCAFGSVAVAAFAAFFAVVALTGTSVSVIETSVTARYALVDCAPPPPPPSSAGNNTTFRERLAPLLAALPAAAAPFGFASLHSDDHSAFVRGICLGFDLEKDCHACLAAAADNLTGACGASRRAGVWRSESCFVAYADASTSSAREDAFRRVVFAGEDTGEGPNCFDTEKLVALAQSMARRSAAEVFGAQEFRDAAALARRDVTGKNRVRVFPDVATVETRVRVVAQCAQDRAAAECARCLGDAARRVPPCSWGLDDTHARVADVVGYGCFLRIETSVPWHLVTEAWPTKPLAIALFVFALLNAIATVIAATLMAAGY